MTVKIVTVNFHWVSRFFRGIQIFNGSRNSSNFHRTGFFKQTRKRPASNFHPRKNTVTCMRVFEAVRLHISWMIEKIYILG